MSYCVQCGVELAKYHQKCPICNTEVIYPNVEIDEVNTDYPDYHISLHSNKKRVNRYVTGFILSLQFFVYSLILLVIDLLTGDGITWSLIPLASLVLLWVTVAYPFFRKRNTFIRLFTYDCIAVLIYLLLLNYLISRNILWAQYTTLGILSVWVIVAGIFLTDRIRKFLPVTLYYCFCFIIISIAAFLVIENRISILHLAVPINLAALLLSILSYFIIRASGNNVITLIVMILVDISILSLVIDATILYYLRESFNLSWSIIVNAVTIPAFTTLLTIKKSREIRLFISKKLHR